MGLDNPLHIAFLVVILLLVFGAKRLPEIGRSLGSGMREFKDSVSGESKPALPPAAEQPQAPMQQAAVQDRAAAPVPAPAQVPPPAPAPTPAQAPAPQQPEQAAQAPAEPTHHR
jgi:sec-independent protein translocase protein TatA